MQTAVYPSNRVPHAAPGIITRYKTFYVKDKNIGHLGAIGPDLSYTLRRTHASLIQRPEKEVCVDTAWAANRSACTTSSSSRRGLPNDFGHPPGTPGNRSSEDEFGYDTD
ncbi:unnamed protein product, partial [Ectocarpus sp. 13 AM-2016]